MEAPDKEPPAKSRAEELRDLVAEDAAKRVAECWADLKAVQEKHRCVIVGAIDTTHGQQGEVRQVVVLDVRPV